MSCFEGDKRSWETQRWVYPLHVCHNIMYIYNYIYKYNYVHTNYRITVNYMCMYLYIYTYIYTYSLSIYIYMYMWTYLSVYSGSTYLQHEWDKSVYIYMYINTYTYSPSVCSSCRLFVGYKEIVHTLHVWCFGATWGSAQIGSTCEPRPCTHESKGMKGTYFCHERTNKTLA